MNKDFIKYKKKAEKLVEDLQRKCTAKTIKENYGQSEIRKFIDKMNADGKQDMNYQEVCEVKGILYKVSSITPKQ